MAHLFGELDIIDAGRAKDGKGKRGDGKVSAVDDRTEDGRPCVEHTAPAYNRIDQALLPNAVCIRTDRALLPSADSAHHRRGCSVSIVSIPPPPPSEQIGWCCRVLRAHDRKVCSVLIVS